MFFSYRGASPLELPYTLARGGPSAPLRSRGSLRCARSRRSHFEGLRAYRGSRLLNRANPPHIEGLRPSNSLTRSLAGAPRPRSALVARFAALARVGLTSRDPGFRIIEPSYPLAKSPHG